MQVAVCLYAVGLVKLAVGVLGSDGVPGQCQPSGGAGKAVQTDVGRRAPTAAADMGAAVRSTGEGI